ncbi:unnamed protein product [Mytilus edulis]|uniref:C-type lectin domain-containing protein n=1 Tax=Mytilus edulis TaxID=6550 RepID=A0A8S3QTF9_MYTED|nr:unnamed protein product [Mytilus edulis]
MTAGKGWKNNVTIYAVKEKVTWYSAKEAINCKISHGLITRTNLLKTFAENTQASDNLNDSIIWIGAIKSENDGQLYYSDTCDLIDLNHIDLPKVPGNRECVFLNISVKTVLFGYDDCMALHPYLCISFSFDNSTETTTELVPMTTTTLECTCTLNECRSFKNSTEILEMIENIKRNLYIDKKQLSSTKRRLISAEDPRTSSQSIGLFGVAILTSVILAIVLADVPRLLSFFKNSSINKIHDHLES